MKIPRFLIVAAVCNTVAAAQETGSSGSDSAAVYNLQEVVVTGLRQQEERLVGPYKQPEWTLARRFPSTRVYVQTPPGEATFEQWIEIRDARDASEKDVTRLRQELSFGLGGRVQLDLYLNTEHVRDEANSTFGFRGWSAEARWALAEWGQIPCNPTMYLEYLLSNGGLDKVEPKLLLGGELATRVHWGLNLIYERELAGHADRDEEVAVTSSISYTFVDQVFSGGGTFAVSSETERSGGEVEQATGFLLGPSVQLRPLKRANLTIEPLIGLTSESMKVRMFVVFGWDL